MALSEIKGGAESQDSEGGSVGGSGREQRRERKQAKPEKPKPRMPVNKAGHSMPDHVVHPIVPLDRSVGVLCGRSVSVCVSACPTPLRAVLI